MPGERFIVGNPENSQDEETNFFGESCQDITGRTIAGGNHYVPGPDSCTVCLCDGGKPKWCQAVLCAAPKDCKSFRIGSSCCEFICLDNTDGTSDEDSDSWDEGNWVGGDFGLRLVATAVTAVLSLALLAFLFYRLKRRRVHRLSACNELEGDTIPSSSIASYDHGDMTSSTGHLSRQPQSLINVGEHQSPVYMMWKLPSSSTTDNPPPYTENPVDHLVVDENDHRETTSLLTLPSAPSPVDIIRDTTTCVLMVRRSNDTLDSEDFLDAGTPPPSYAEVLACISNPTVNELEENSSIGENALQNPPQLRNSLHLPNDRSSADVAIQRFSLQLALDCSDTSSCTSTSSHAQPLSTSSSSSAASIVHHGSD